MAYFHPGKCHTPQGFTPDPTLFNFLVFMDDLKNDRTETAKTQQPQIFRWVSSRNNYGDIQKDLRQPDDWPKKANSTVETLKTCNIGKRENIACTGISMEVGDFTEKINFSLSHDLCPQTAEAPPCCTVHPHSRQVPSASGTERAATAPVPPWERLCPTAGQQLRCLPHFPWLTAWGSAGSHGQVLLCLLLPTTHDYTHGSLRCLLASVSARVTQQGSRGQRMQQERERGCIVTRSRRRKDRDRAGRRKGQEMGPRRECCTAGADIMQVTQLSSPRHHCRCIHINSTRAQMIESQN